MQDGASAWFTKLDASRVDWDWLASVVALPDPPATAPAAWTGVDATTPGRFAVGSAIGANPVDSSMLSPVSSIAR